MKYKPTSRIEICCFLLPIILLFAIVAPAQERRPLDPLTPQEKALAERAALADRRVQELLGSARRQTISVELFAPKITREQVETAAAGRDPGMHRFTEVIFFRYEGEVGVRAIVDLTSKEVSEVTRLSSDQVPMTQADVSEAWQLAVKNEQVRKAVGAEVDRFQPQSGPTRPGRGAYTVEALRVESSDERDPCSKHRCLRLLLRRGTDYLMKPIIVVDLSAREARVEEKER